MLPLDGMQQQQSTQRPILFETLQTLPGGPCRSTVPAVKNTMRRFVFPAVSSLCQQPELNIISNKNWNEY
jgi:hypothetical protein